jgi:hypothetical protein
VPRTSSNDTIKFKLKSSEHLEIQTAHRVLIERSFYAAELVASPKCLSTVRAHQVTSPIISNLACNILIIIRTSSSSALNSLPAHIMVSYRAELLSVNPPPPYHRVSPLLLVGQQGCSFTFVRPVYSNLFAVDLYLPLPLPLHVSHDGHECWCFLAHWPPPCWATHSTQMLPVPHQHLPIPAHCRVWCVRMSLMAYAVSHPLLMLHHPCWISCLVSLS